MLVGADGPVVIDFPQVVSAAGNNAARTMLLRDVHNLRDCLGRFAPELNATHYGEEMWALYEKGTLRPDSALTGRFAFDTRRAERARGARLDRGRAGRRPSSASRAAEAAAQDD